MSSAPPRGARVPVLVIAEAGVNHDGDAAKAERLVAVAREAGADVVKFQTFRPEALVSQSAPKAEYQKARGPEGESQLAMLQKLALDEAGHRRALRAARRAGIEFMSTPFDEGSADFLVGLGVRRLKIGSGEMTNLPLLRHVARTGLPVMLSTGMASLLEVLEAVECMQDAGARDLTLLHCVTEYPAPLEAVNLRAIGTLAAATGLPVGYSDHTLGNEAALAAVALGACVIEKHFTLDRTAPGPDHAASLEPAELEALVRSIRAVEMALGNGRKEAQPCELGNRDVARRSLVATRRLRKGEALSPANVAILRPGTGIAPKDYEKALGLRTSRVIELGQPIGWRDLKA